MAYLFMKASWERHSIREKAGVSGVSSGASYK
jgi:hypothetical protein